MVRCAVWGTGRAGVELVKAGLQRPWLEWVGAGVFGPAKEGADLGDLAGIGPLGVAATADIDALLARDDIDLVFYAGLGPDGPLADRMERIVRAGKDAVTVSGIVHPRTALGEERAARLHDACVANGRRAIGAGVNPGFLLDVLPAVWATCNVSFTTITAKRVSDMKTWGPGVHRDLGIGRRPGEFELAETPMALDQSLMMIAGAVGLTFDRVENTTTPFIAKTRREYRGEVVEPGTIGGYTRRSAGVVGGVERIVLDWTAVFGLTPEVDGIQEEGVIQIDGDPWLEMRFKGGVFEDPYPATAARGLAVVPGLLRMPPGLYDSSQVPIAAPAPR